MKDSSITHHIVDRPKLPSSYDDLPKSREYIQPQWLLDSANFSFLLPTSRYAVGAELPPHLSPWIDNAEEGYTPAYAEEIECLKNGTVLPSKAIAGEPADAAAESDGENVESEKSDDDSDEQDGTEEVEEDSEEEEEDEKQLEKKRAKRKHREVSFKKYVLSSEVSYYSHHFYLNYFRRRKLRLSLKQ